MDLNQISTFVRVMDAGSFTKAARVLRQPKSRVSRNIAALEKELGVALLYRTTRQFSPTEAGKTLYEISRHHIYELESVSQSLGGSEEIGGKITVTTADDVGTVLFGPLLSEIGTLYPKLQVNLVLSDDVVDLVREGVDLALRIGELQDTSLKAKRLGKVTMILVASPAYLRRTPSVQKVSDLASHRTLLFTNDGESEWHLKMGKQEERTKIRPVFKCNSPRVLAELAQAGNGIALVPEFLCTDALRTGTLERVLPNYATEPDPIQFVWPAQRETHPRIRAFVETASRYLQKYFPA